jgi:AraC-like DNA-binding protein
MSTGEIHLPNAYEFVILYGPRLRELQNDAKSMAAAAFKRKHGIAPQDYRKRITRFRELVKGQEPINGPRGDEIVQLMRFFVAVWGRQRL